MKRILLLMLMLAFYPVYAEPPLKVGIFNLFDVNELQSLNAKATRIILKDTAMRRFYEERDNGNLDLDSAKLRNIKNIHNAGIDIIVTIRWPESPGSPYDRIPRGSERKKSLRLLERFLRDFGPYINVYSLQNECFVGPGRYRPEDISEDASGDIAAIKWFEDLAQTARRVMASDPKLSHIKISSPVWQGVSTAATGKDNQWTRDPILRNLLSRLIVFSNEYCDYIDLHLLKVPFEDMAKTIDFVKQRTTLPLITTEWSQAYATGTWLEQPISLSFKKKYENSIQLSAVRTNLDFVNFCYKHRVSEALWNDFASSIPHDKDFMKKCCDIFRSENFIYCCWALGYQYGEPVYDLKCLFANLTTSSRLSRNQPMYDEFKALQK